MLHVDVKVFVGRKVFFDKLYSVDSRPRLQVDLIVFAIDRE